MPPGTTPTDQPTPTTTASPSAVPQSPPPPTARPTPGEGQISHPTGATDVILRMEQQGGFVPIEWMLTQAPEFTLYGDGTFIFRPLEDPIAGDDWNSPQPRFLQGRLDEESVQAVLEFALGPGRLAQARESYQDDTVVDASTTVFTIDAGGFSKVVSVYALGEVHEPRVDAADRAGFNQLVQFLRSFEGRARSGELGEVALYEPTHYRASLLEAFDDPQLGDPLPWPWPHLSPDDFQSLDEWDVPQAILTAEDVAALTEVPSGGHPAIPVVHEQGEWRVAIRPLLPDEVPAD